MTERRFPPPWLVHPDWQTMKPIIWLMFALALAGCNSSSGASNAQPGCTTYNEPCPIPGADQWAEAFGAKSQIVGTTFPMLAAPGIHYVYTPASGLALGKTMTLTYTLTEAAGTVLTHDDSSDIDPPTISLFIWERGDDLTCGLTSANQAPSTAGPMQGYRQFLTARSNLTSGHTLSAVLRAANWGGCFGSNATYFANAVANAAYMGFTMSGQYFAGHGVDLKSGSATFTINSFTVQ